MPALSPTTGLLLGRGEGQGGTGGCAVFPTQDEEVGQLPWELCQSQGTAGAQATRTLCLLKCPLV